MPLTDKKRYDLVLWLAERYDNTSAPTVVLSSGLPTAIYNFHQAPMVFWSSIVGDLERKISSTGSILLIDLLQHILKENYKNDRFLEQICEELKNNYSTKLNLLAKAIAANQCVLFLGPGILLCNRDGSLIPFSKLLAKRLAIFLKNQKIYFDETQVDNLNYISQRYSDNPTHISGDQGREAKALFEECIANGEIDFNLFNLISKLPFKIVINSNPDESLANIINSQTPGKCVTRYYDYSKVKNEDITEPLQDDSILLYNLLGSFRNPISILTTESQLLNFTKKVIEGSPPLDKQVRLEFDEHKYYLFLGFDLDHWYIKVVFEMVLRLVKQDDRSFSIFSSNWPFSSFNREFFEEEFKFYFIDENINRFITKLVNFYMSNK